MVYLHLLKDIFMPGCSSLVLSYTSLDLNVYLFSDFEIVSFKYCLYLSL